MTTTTTDMDTMRPSPAQVSAKRALDLAVTVSALMLLWPLLIILAAAVALTSRGPVVFRQTRIGLNGVPFRMIKFRSMYTDAEALRAELVRKSDRDGLCLELRHDPRVTPIGRVLRRWSLDEAPQLFNVLTGEMSLVGPRPALPEEVAAYPAHAHFRHRVKPGLTGLWQVSGRADLSFQEMIDLDLAYTRSAGVGRDLIVLVLTIPAVLSGRGAY